MTVRAPRLEARALLAAMERGDFYASNGVELSDYQVTDKAMTVTVKQTAFSKYRVQFIGKVGQAPGRGDRKPGNLFIPRRRGLRSCQSCRKQWPVCLVPAGDAEIGLP